MPLSRRNPGSTGRAYPAACNEKSLRMGRHLLLFKGHVFARNGVVLLELELALHRTLVLSRVISESGAGGGDEPNVVAHSGRLVPHRK